MDDDKVDREEKKKLFMEAIKTQTRFDPTLLSNLYFIRIVFNFTTTSVKSDSVISYKITLFLSEGRLHFPELGSCRHL